MGGVACGLKVLFQIAFPMITDNRPFVRTPSALSHLIPSSIFCRFHLPTAPVKVEFNGT